MKLSAIGVEAGTAVVNSQRGVEQLNAKLKLGKSYRWFFRVTKGADGTNDCFSVTYPVRALDDRLHCNSVVNLGDDWEQDPTTLKIIDKTGLAPYARITSVLHRAECEMVKAKTERTKKLDAEDAGQDTNSKEFIAELAVAINKIEMKYFGDRETETYATVHPLIGGIKLATFVELAVVELNEDGKPDFKTASVAAWDVTSGARREKIMSAMRESYITEDGFLEVHVAYGINATDKAQAGRNLKLSNVSKTSSISESYKEGYREFAGKVLKGIADNPETLAVRSSGCVFSKTPGAVIEAVKKYLSTTPGVFAKIDLEADEVRRVAKDFCETGILDSQPVIRDKMMMILKEQESGDESRKDEDDTDVDFGEAVQAVTLSELSQIRAAEDGATTDGVDDIQISDDISNI